MNKSNEVLEQELFDEVKKAVVYKCVIGWKVQQVNIKSKSVGVVLELEGHSEYMLGIVYNGKNDELTTNVATFGTFNICDDSAIVEFYTAVGNLLTKKSFLFELKETLKKYMK